MLATVGCEAKLMNRLPTLISAQTQAAIAPQPKIRLRWFHSERCLRCSAASRRVEVPSSGSLARQIIITLCERLRATNAQVDQAIFHDLRYRLLVLLRQIAVIHGRIEKDVAVVDLDVTQGMLAQMLGASREAVNKQLRALAKEGGLVMDGHQIRIMKQPQL